MTPLSDDIESKIIMQGIHVDLTEGLRTAILDKFATLVRRNEEILRINVRLHMDQTMGRKHHFSGTAQVEIGGPDLNASAEGQEAYGVIDALGDTVARLLHERQGRRKDKRNHPHEIELDAIIPKAE